MDRDYQIRLFNDVRTAIGQGKRKILIVLPTGAGKGRCAARIMQMSSTKGNPSVFFAEQRELIEQINAHLASFSLPSNVVMAGYKNEYISQADADASSLNNLIAKNTLWSRAFRTSKMEIPDARVVHIDEAHQSMSKTYQTIAEHYKGSIIIGWTATPCRSDNKPLGAFYDHLVIGASYKELQDNGYLVPVRVVAPKRPDLKGCKISKGDYQKKDLEQRMNRDEMVGNIVQEWAKYSDGRRTVVFAAGVQHSIHIRNQFLKLGVVAEHIDGDMPEKERDAIIEEARNGKIDVICNYGVATTGIDIPAWKYMVCARPTKSFALWRQMGGRIQRPYAGYDHCFIQDHSDNSMVFGYPDEDVEWTIDGDEDIAKKHQETKRKERDASGEEKGEMYRCDTCHCTYRGPQCPMCGTKAERRGKEIKMKAGELKEIERKKLNKKDTTYEKQKHWDECVGICIKKGMKIGAAAHMYKDKYGVFPTTGAGLTTIPRSTQWAMTAKKYYHEVIKPEIQKARDEAKNFNLLEGIDG
jgi:DNA repair protein RadD